MIWRANKAKGEPVELRAWLGGQGLGWFVLEQVVDGNFQLIARTTKAPDPDDDLTHQFSAASLEASGWASLSLRLKLVAGNPNQTDMPLFMTVRQAGKILSATTNNGERLNGASAPYAEVRLQPDAPHARPYLWDFAVYF